MKVDLIRKLKWYIIGFILIAIMLSVSLSFCAWDTLSIKASLSGKGGGYRNRIKVNEYVTLEDDKFLPNNVPGLNDLVDVGDIVTFGKYYQQDNTTTKTDIRWIVVEKDGTKLTLLAEKVVVYGNFWGNTIQYYQNYYQSTVRSWLNSGKGSLQGSGTTWDDTKRYNDNTRNDGLPVFSGSGSQVNKGFLDVAFTGGAEKLLVPKKIEGMQGRGINNNPSTIDAYKTTDGRNYVNDLVWLPSWQEIYGTKENPWSGMSLYDGTPNTKFSYFNDIAVYSGSSPNRNWKSAKAISSATDYAWNATSSSYYNNGGGSTNGSQAATCWWLRSPSPSNYHNAVIVNTVGSGNLANTDNSYGGVRPAVCVQL